MITVNKVILCFDNGTTIEFHVDPQTFHLDQTKELKWVSRPGDTYLDCKTGKIRTRLAFSSPEPEASKL